jgi:hypothetical protein
MINSPEFGARILAESFDAGSSATPRIDYVEIEVYYQPFCPVGAR